MRFRSLFRRGPEPSARPKRPTPTHVYDCAGLDWNEPELDRRLILLERYRAEFGVFPEDAVGNDRVYHYRNPYFSLVDAAVCHSFVRDRAPDVVVEIGSGYSSRVIRAALDRNGTGRLVSIDPDPRVDVREVAHERYATTAQDVPRSLFDGLTERSILFVDSSHRVGAAGDVNRLFLEILPALRSGVLVHVHDIYLPEDYPASWNIDEGWNYTEQYLLHALLTFSSGFRIVWPGRHAMRTRGAALARLFPVELLGLTCSFWLERV